MESSFKIKLPQKLDLNSYLKTIETTNDDYQILNQHLKSSNPTLNLFNRQITSNDDILQEKKPQQITKQLTLQSSYKPQYLQANNQNYGLEQKLNFPNYRVNLPNAVRNYYL